eukprot:COSAG04_NODE_3000_length_3291_cov_2.643595_2_plen_235_part_00
MARGGNVAIFDLNAERGGELVSELGDQTAFFECNVMEEESIDAAVAGAHEKFGALHGAVNCAGGQIGTGLTVNRRGEAFAMDKWWATVKLNAFGTFAVCSKVSAIASQQDEVTEDGERGVLVNVASVAAQDGQDGQSAYSAGKGAIVAMTLPMARDLSRVGIRVCTILPGTMGTPMTDPMKDSAIGVGLKDSTPFPPRFGYPEEFAGLACHIIENGFLNGESIRLDGSIRMPKL